MEGYALLRAAWEHLATRATRRQPRAGCRRGATATMPKCALAPPLMQSSPGHSCGSAAHGAPRRPNPRAVRAARARVLWGAVPTPYSTYARHRRAAVSSQLGAATSCHASADSARRRRDCRCGGWCVGDARSTPLTIARHGSDWRATGARHCRRRLKRHALHLPALGAQMPGGCARDMEGGSSTKMRYARCRRVGPRCCQGLRSAEHGH